MLVDSKSSTTRFDVFDVDQGFLRIDGKNSSSDTIRKVAVGQVKTGGSDEIVEIRTTKPGNDALRVYEWDTSDGELDTIKGWAFAPQPDAVFLADLAGNGDQEILFLRSHPSEDAPRLIMLNEWGDDQKTLIDIEISLADIEGGKDDRFKIGAGGDIDGDGRDEIVIASDTRIVVFNDPHRTVGADSRTEYLLPTNNDTLKVGDLDAMGFIEGPMFGTDKNLVSAAVPTGTSGKPIQCSHQHHHRSERRLLRHTKPAALVDRQPNVRRNASQLLLQLRRDEFADRGLSPYRPALEQRQCRQQALFHRSGLDR